MSIENENDIYWRFFTKVIGSLRGLLESSPTKKQAVLEIIGKIKLVTADFETYLRDEANKTHTNEIGAQSVPSGPRDKWLSEVKEFAPRERSIAREIEILSVLDETSGAVVLRHLIDHLTAMGLIEKEKQAAVVTQISRMKGGGLVASEMQGAYLRTDKGREHLQKRRKSYPTLFAPDAARKGKTAGP